MDPLPRFGRTVLGTLTLSSNVSTDAHNNNRLANSNTAKQQGSVGEYNFLFRKPNGDAWILFYRSPSGKIKGLLTIANKRSFLFLSVKGLPNYLKIEHLDRACTLLQESTVRLTGHELEISPNLRGGMLQAESSEAATSLHMACRTGDVASVQSLLASEANPNEGDEKGLIPLHWAAKKGHEAIVQVLLQYTEPKVAINSQTLKGKTALHFSTKKGHAAIVKKLLAAGIVKDKVDYKSRTAFDLANRLTLARSALIRSSGCSEQESTLYIPIKYLDDREAPEFSVLGSGAYNTVYKVTYWQNGQKRTAVYKREILLVEGTVGIHKILGINPNDPKTAFRNCLYAEMAERLGLAIVPRTRLGIYNRELYRVKTLAEGCMAAGRTITVRVIDGCDLAQDLDYFYRQWQQAGKGSDWQSYSKLLGISNLLSAHGMTGIEEPFIERKKLVWYGSALRAPKVPVNFEDPNLHAALCAMQLLDLLLFQLDRNLSNFFIKTDGEGNFEKLTTIDNDFCVSKYYLDPKTLELADATLARTLRLPAGVLPEVARKFLNLSESTVEGVFKVFGTVFDKAELEASQRMLRESQAHLRQIKAEGKTAKDFVADTNGLLVGWKQHTQLTISKQVLEGTIWENVDTLLNTLPEAIDAKDEEGRTALHRAAACGEEKIVRLLLYRGAQIEAKDKYKHTPLQLAVSKSHLQAVALLIEKGALGRETESLEASYQALALAVEQHHTTVAALLRDELIKINPNFITQALLLASSKKDSKLTEFLLGQDALSFYGSEDKSESKPSEQ